MTTLLGACDLGDVFYIRTYDPADATTGIAVDGVLTDPTTLTFRIEEPDGTTTDYTYASAQIIKAGTGRFYRAHQPDQAGLHVVQMLGTGAAAFSERVTFYVRDALDAP